MSFLRKIIDRIKNKVRNIPDTRPQFPAGVFNRETEGAKER
jgi:hypothetical protein